MRSFLRLSLIGITFLILATGCDLQSTPKTVTVTGLGWVIENLPQSYWSSPQPSTCYYDFWIYYTGNISLGDIEHARIYNSGKTWKWDISLVEANFKSTNIGGWLRFYAGNAPNTLPIGTLTAEIKLKNSIVSSYDKVIPAPGSTTTLGYSNVYTEECGTPPANSIDMIKRPAVTGPSINYSEQTLSINFTIDHDIRVFNGWVWLYDESNYTVAYSKTHFKDSVGALTSIISSSFSTDGTPNTVSITNDDLIFLTSKSFSDIKKFMVVVTDGNQFTPQGKYTSYDCLAVSEKTAF